MGRGRMASREGLRVLADCPRAPGRPTVPRGPVRHRWRACRQGGRVGPWGARGAWAGCAPRGGLVERCRRLRRTCWQCPGQACPAQRSKLQRAGPGFRARKPPPSRCHRLLPEASAGSPGPLGRFPQICAGAWSTAHGEIVRQLRVPRRARVHVRTHALVAGPRGRARRPTARTSAHRWRCHRGPRLKSVRTGQNFLRFTSESCATLRARPAARAGPGADGRSPVRFGQ
mmetsp:Transcript_21142/g.71044  ORF Transcript_21142/g.71044 Transcript_21142/m.71044 type:complete len:229 (-) Transcript_21142:76-762(-)